MIGRNPGKTPIVGMPSAFDFFLEVGPLQKHGTLQQLLNIFVSLKIYLDALVDIEKFL